MKETLPIIEKAGLMSALMDFVSRYFPNMVEMDELDAELISIERYFTGQTLTYPRRILIQGQPDNLNANLMKFLDGKIKYEYIISNGKALVEYLSEDDREIADKVPDTKWLIKNYQAKRRKR
jgi:hypothetical protein